jgi:hypothetical protein
MTVDEDLGRAAAAAGALRRAVAALQSRLGETVDVRRLADDVTRVESDLELLRAAAGGRGTPPAPAEVVYIPEGEYDPALFAGADDELGPHGRA